MKKRLLCFCAVILIMIAFSIMHINALKYIPDSVDRYYFTKFNEGDSRVIFSSVSYSYADSIKGEESIPGSLWVPGYFNENHQNDFILYDFYDLLQDSQVDGSTLNGGTFNLSMIMDIANGFDFSVYSNQGTLVGFHMPIRLDTNFLYSSDPSEPLYNMKLWINTTGSSSPSDYYLLYSLPITAADGFTYVDLTNLSIPITTTPLFKLDFSFRGDVASNTFFRFAFPPSESYIDVERGFFEDNVDRYLDSYLDAFGNLRKPDPIDFSGFDITNVSFYPLSLSLFTDLHSNSSFIPIFSTILSFTTIFGFYSFIIFGMKR